MQPKLELILITYEILYEIRKIYNISDIYQIWYHNFDKSKNIYSCIFIYYREGELIYSYFNFDANNNKWKYIKDIYYRKFNNLKDITLLYENDDVKVPYVLTFVVNSFTDSFYFIAYLRTFILFMILLNIVLFAYFKNIYIVLYSLLFSVLYVAFIFFSLLIFPNLFY